MRIAFVTDIHETMGRVGAFADAVGAVDLLLFGGDVTNFGDARRAKRVVDDLRGRFPRVFGVGGNTDHWDVHDWLADEGLSLHGRAVRVGDVAVQGCGGSNPTPMGTPGEHPEETIAAALAAGAAHETDAPVRLLVSHAPPRDTRADRLAWGSHAGSMAVRDFLERGETAVAACLCGHIHEGVGTDQVGATLVCNPGAFLAGCYAVVEVSADGVRPCIDARIEALPIARHARVADTLQVFGTKVVGLARHHLGRLWRQ